MVAPSTPPPPCTCAPSQLPKPTQSARIHQIFRSGHKPPATATAAPITSPRNPLVYALGLKRLLTHCDCCLRANWRPGCFLCSSHRFFPEESLPASPPQGWGGWDAEGGLGRAGTRPGTEVGKGPVPSGTGARRSAEIRTPREAQRKTQTRRAPSSQRPGRQRRQWSPGSAAATRALTRAGAARC